MKPVKTFISYAHQDEAFKNELVEMLDPMISKKTIDIWTDRNILVGDKWNDEIIKALEEADLVLFLLSASFFASAYINKVEIVRAMEQHQQNGRKRLVPIMVRNCDVGSHVVPDMPYKIGDFQGLPTNFLPISKWPDRDDAWMNVVQGLRPTIQLLQQQS